MRLFDSIGFERGAKGRGGMAGRGSIIHRFDCGSSESVGPHGPSAPGPQGKGSPQKVARPHGNLTPKLRKLQVGKRISGISSGRLATGRITRSTHSSQTWMDVRMKVSMYVP